METKKGEDRFDSILRNIATRDDIKELPILIEQATRSIIQRNQQFNGDEDVYQSDLSRLRDAIKENKRKNRGQGGAIDKLKFRSVITGRTASISSLRNTPKNPWKARGERKKKAKRKEEEKGILKEEKQKKREKEREVKQKEKTESEAVDSAIKTLLKRSGRVARNLITDDNKEKAKNAISNAIVKMVEDQKQVDLEMINEAIGSSRIREYINADVSGRVAIVRGLIDSIKFPDLSDKGDGEPPDIGDAPLIAKQATKKLVRKAWERYSANPEQIKRDLNVVKPLWQRYYNDPWKIVSDVTTAQKAIGILGGVTTFIYYFWNTLKYTVGVSVDTIAEYLAEETGIPAEVIKPQVEATIEMIQDKVLPKNKTKLLKDTILEVSEEYDMEPVIKKINTIPVDSAGKLDLSGVRITDKPPERLQIEAPGDDVDISGVRITDKNRQERLQIEAPPILNNNNNNDVNIVMNETQIGGSRFTPKPGDVPSFDIAGKARDARPEFMGKLQSKLRELNVQDFSGLEEIPNEVMRAYVEATDKDALVNTIAQTYSKQVSYTPEDHEKSIVDRLTSKVIGKKKRDKIEKRANRLIKNLSKTARKQGKKIGKKALKLSVELAIAAENEYDRQKQRQVVAPAQAPAQAQAEPEPEQAEPEQAPEQAEPEIKLDDLPAPPTTIPSGLDVGLAQGVAGPLGAIRAADARQSNIAQAQADYHAAIKETTRNAIKVKAEEDPGYEGDQWLRPEFRNIVQDVEKLKWMDVQENEERENENLADIVYVEEVNTEYVGDFDDDNIINQINKQEEQIRYTDNILVYPDFTPAGTRLEMVVPQVDVKRKEPINDLSFPMYVHDMAPAELTDRYTPIHDGKLDEMDTLATYNVLDESLMIKKLSLLPNPRNLPLPRLMAIYRMVRV